MTFIHTAEDEQAIRQAALDYIESQHNVDRAQLERSVHPRLVKRTFWTNAATKKTIPRRNEPRTTRLGGGKL